MKCVNTLKSATTVTRCVKCLVPPEFSQVLTDLYPIAFAAARSMVLNRELKSSKDWKTLPCVIAKSLITKYQRNLKCKTVTRLVIPICGDKGKQIKLVDGGVRIPAVFKKSVFPVKWPLPIEGHVRSVEFIRRDHQWFASFCYNTLCKNSIIIAGVIGVDRNSVGNIAVLADPQSGVVRKLGINPAKTKHVYHNRRRNLQLAGKTQLLAKIKRKQSHRMTYENHRVSKTVVDYAVKHCRAIVLEDLGSVRNPRSKIKRYSEKSQWSFFQLETFILYKAALHGIPICFINPAYTSQMCSRCGSLHKTNSKRYHCLTCGHNEHRDANAAFNIAKRGLNSFSMLSGLDLSVPKSGLLDDPQAGNRVSVTRIRRETV